MAGVASLMLATSVSAGASSTSGKYNAADAKLVPSTYKGKTLQVATDATYAPDEYMNNGVMTGFDVKMMYAIAKTLGITVKESNVTFDCILLGIGDGRYAIGNSSVTDEKSREKQVYFVDYFQAGEAVYAKTSTTATFPGLKSLCGYTVAVETGTTEQSDAKATAKTCPKTKKLTYLSYLNPDRSGPGGFLRSRDVRLLGQSGRGLRGLAEQGCLQVGGQRYRSCPLRHRDSEDPQRQAVCHGDSSGDQDFDR